jgi:hypothetical protein
MLEAKGRLSSSPALDRFWQYKANIKGNSELSGKME